MYECEGRAAAAAALELKNRTVCRWRRLRLAVARAFHEQNV